MPTLSILVRSEWDPEAGVFVATSEDVPGLVAEAATADLLLDKLKILIPELLELNEVAPSTPATLREVPLYVVHQQVTKIRVPA